MVLIIEPFICNSSIKQKNNICIIITEPQFEKLVLKNSQPHEGKLNGYYKIVQCGDVYRMYYRASSYEFERNKNGAVLYKSQKESYNHECTCVAYSKNGLDFEKPELRLVKYKEDVKNNIIMKNNSFSHNFYPTMIDENNFVAIGGQHIVYSSQKGVFLFRSTDGLKWTKKERLFKMKDSLPCFKATCYDSHNAVIFDKLRGKYYFFIRLNPKKSVRSIQISESTDLKKVTKFKEIVPQNFTINEKGSMYALNAFVYPNSEYMMALCSYQNGNNRNTKTVTLLSSDDAYTWTKILDKDFLSEHYNNAYTSVSGMAIAEGDLKMYVYLEDAKNHDISCFSYGLHRIAEIVPENEDVAGEIETKLLNLESSTVYLNFKTNNDGKIKVELYDENNTKVSESKELIGDEHKKIVESLCLFRGTTLFSKPCNP